jgi:hypothetical protein
MNTFRHAFLSLALIGFVAPFMVANLALAAPLCGDHDGSGSVVASDALLVLRKAVDLDVELSCPSMCNVTTTSSTTSTSSPIIHDECFEDSGCREVLGWPPGFICVGFRCVDCISSTDCDQGFLCIENACVLPGE